MPSKLIALMVLFLAAVSLPALEIQRGKIKLVVNEKTGRFIVYGTEDMTKPVWTPLSSADDPTTSKWKLLIGDKTAVLGDDPSFTTAVAQTDTGVKIVWTSKTLLATMDLSFLLSMASQLADGVQIGLTVANLSENPVKVGIRWVLDTYLGEKKDHFKLFTGETINSETKLEGTFPEWWASNSSFDEKIGLIVMVGKGVTPPSRVFFANWKRLDDSAWDYSYKQGRDFNLLPYSVNDSAVAQYYDPVELPSGGSRQVVAVMGLKSGQTFAGARVGSANPLDDLLKKNQNPALGAVDQDISSLRMLMTQIETKMADPSKVTPEDLKLLQAVLEQLEARNLKPVATPKP